MKKIFYGFLALAGLAMVSCSQEIDEQINANTDSVKKVFTANTEDGASTRTSIALEEETGNYVVIWNGDEKIAVNGVDYKVIEGAGTKSVTFGADVEGTEAATAEVYNAVYPNNAWAEGGLNLEHLKEQTALNATYGHGYAVTVATTTNTEMDFKFKNALSFLRVRFSLAADAKEDAITIKTVKITANDNLWGTVSEVNYATGEIGAVANDSELGKSIVYTAGEDVVLDRAENAIFDAVIAVPVNEEGRTLTIEITGENAWTGTPYTYKAEGVTKKYLRNNVTTLAKAIKPVEVLLVADGVYKTAENTFQIFNANGMKWLADAVNSGNSFANNTVQLIDDIDLSVFDNWTPIGFNENGIVESTDKYFTGTFDGQGHTIYNLNIENDNAGGVGLFGAVHDATFKNFTLENVNIKAVDADASSDISGAQGQANYIVGGHIGAVAAYDAKAGTVTFDNVHLKGLIKIEGETRYAQGQRIAGVFGGKSSSKVVFNKVSVMGEDGSYIKGYCSTAGVVGQHMGVGTFTDVHTDIDVYGVTFGVGGIAGITLKDSTFDNCSSAGDLTLDARAVQPASYSGNYFFRIGGIAGCWSESANAKLTLTNCSYTGTFKSFNKEGNSPFAFDYDGYVGRGFTLNGCAGSTVIIDGKEFVQVTDNIHGFYMVDGVYEISSEAGLKWLAAQVKEGNTFDGKTVKLVQNIALTEPWTPIGNNTDGVSKSFRGNFDGQNHTISDMVVNAGDAAAGFFGSKWDGDIKDVKFDNATITGSHYGGVVVGWADGANYNYNWTISGCEITNSTVTLAVENNDNGDKAGAVVGYAYAITVTENVVSNTTIQAYRDFGGIVGMAQENTTTDPHSEYAVVSNNTIGENVKLIVDNTTNYQNYEIRSKYNVGQYVGRVSCHSVVEGNTGEATIEWGEIPAEIVVVATVDGVEYTELGAALEAAADGGTVVLVDDMTLSENLTIPADATTVLDLNNKTITATTAGNSGNQIQIDVRGDLTVKNGTFTTQHTGINLGWNAMTEVFYVGFNGSLTVDNATIENLGGSDMAYAIDVVNATDITLNITNSTIKSTYIPVRIFNNSSTGMNNVTIENTTLEGVSRALWVHMFTDADTGGKGVRSATLNLDIYGNGNTFIASNPYRLIEFGFTNPINFDAEGNLVVRNAKALEYALGEAAKAGAGDTLITIEENLELDMSEIDWTPVKVDGYNGADIVTLNGNGATLKGLNAALFEGGFAGNCGIVVNDLTIKDSTMSATNTTGYGAFVCAADSMEKVVLTNCHADNVTITTPENAESRMGVLIGWTAGYSESYPMTVTVEGCSVKNSTINGFGSVGGIIGHAGNNAYTYMTITDCVVEGNTLHSTDDGGWRVGAVVGTANVGTLAISNTTINNNAISQVGKTAPVAPFSEYYGRFVPGTTGVLTIDGTELPVVAEINGVWYKTLQAALSAAQDNDVINLYPGTYNFGGLSIAPATVTIKGTDKAGVVINMNQSIYLSGKTVNFENLTYTAPAGLGYTEQAFAFVHHAAGFNFDNCVINRLRVNVASATIKNSTFEVITNSGFDGYGLYYYGNDKSNVKVENCVFNTTGKAICVYSESAKEYNLTVNDTQFYSSNTSTDKAAVSIHTEYGIYGTLTMNRCEATGFIANNNGLWRELNNNTKVDTKNFTKVIDGVVIEDITGGFSASADGEVVVW